MIRRLILWVGLGAALVGSVYLAKIHLPHAPMPWANLSHATLGSSDADLKAIWTYLRNLPPAKNRVPEPISSLPNSPRFAVVLPERR